MANGTRKAQATTATDSKPETKVETTYVNARLTTDENWLLEQVAALSGEKTIDYVTRVVVEAIRRDANPEKIKAAMQAKLDRMGTVLGS